MVEHMQTRLAELRREYQLGEGQLRTLIQQEAALRETLLRIGGAIQVLAELLPEGVAGTTEADVRTDTEADVTTMTVG